MLLNILLRGHRRNKLLFVFHVSATICLDRIAGNLPESGKVFSSRGVQYTLRLANIATYTDTNPPNRQVFQGFTSCTINILETVAIIQFPNVLLAGSII